jgi:hypothetical protein
MKSTLHSLLFLLSSELSWCYRRKQMAYGKTPMNKAVDMQKLKGLTAIG